MLARSAPSMGSFPCRYLHLCLHAVMIRPPLEDRFLDLRRSELFIESAFGQRRKLGIGGEAQANQLSLRQFGNASAQRFRQECHEAETLFEPNDTVLYFQWITPKNHSQQQQSQCERHRQME
jgi:hypothetical protein